MDTTVPNDISPSAFVAPTARVWHLAQVRENAQIHERVILGRGVYVGPGVTVGFGSKIQNGAMIYEPASIGNGVFIGPSVVLTNDRYPRAVNPDFTQKTPTDWKPVGVTVLNGASIGAGAVCVAPITIGNWAVIAAGSVVTKDVPDFALVAGNPARQRGWVGRSGWRLTQVEGETRKWVCPQTEETYTEDDQGFLTLEGTLSE